MQPDPERVEKILNLFETQINRLEKSLIRLEVAQVMQNLMVMQLDGRIEIDEEILKLYLDALSGVPRKINTFRKHVLDKYSKR